MGGPKTKLTVVIPTVPSQYSVHVSASNGTEAIAFQTSALLPVKRGNELGFFPVEI